MRKTLVFITLLLGAGMVFGGDACAKTQDASTLFASPVVGQLKSIGQAFLGAAFMVEVVRGIYKMVFGRESWTVLGMTVGKYALLFALFTYSGDALSYFSEFKSMSETADQDDIGKVQAAMTEVNVAMWALVEGTPPEKKETEAGFWDSVTSGMESILKVLSGHYILILLLTLAIQATTMLSLIMKILVINIIWPILFQLALLGIVFAVPFAAVSGWGAIKNFAVTVIELALWPVFYWMCFNLTVGSLTCNLNELLMWINEQKALAESAASNGANAVGAAVYTANISGAMLNLPLLSLIFAHLIFFLLLPMLVPTIAHLVVHHQGAGQVAQGLGGGITHVFSGAVRRAR